MKIAIGSISHETNTFSNVNSDIDKFKEKGLYEDQEIIRVFEDKRALGSGFIDVARARGVDLVPTLWTFPFAGGLVNDEAFDFMLNRIISGIQSADHLDGVLLELHGAMVTESYDDAEGEILSTMRNIVGREIPIVATLDLHANVSEQMVKEADVLVGYDTYPHIDRYDRGIEAMEIILGILDGKIKPTMHLSKPRMIPTPTTQNTNYSPMKKLIGLAHEIEDDFRIINATVTAGFAYADVCDIGMGMIVTTNNEPALAEEKAKQLADLAWSLRRNFLSNVTPIKEAIKEAVETTGGPVVLADQADNPGGGAPCDGTAILKMLLEMKIKNVCVCNIRDPEAVAKAIAAGVGNTVTMLVGGKTDNLHGAPLKVTGRVKRISDGQFTNTGPINTGLKTKLGRTVILDCEGIEIILTELKVQPIDLEHYQFLGITPTKKKIIVVKSAVHFRAVHEPIAKRIIEVDGPGIHGTRLSAFTYKKVKRPIFPLDPEYLGISELRRSITEEK